LQKVTLIATKPLNDGNWLPLHEGELQIVKGGEIVDSVRTSASATQSAVA
jgi:hypothetical protein